MENGRNKLGKERNRSRKYPLFTLIREWICIVYKSSLMFETRGRNACASNTILVENCVGICY